ncbi:glucokinase [Embleya scabrispora]|uniref:glucokinase n=1 Tax=Embleya scabrispora TaxID=159449 RepID=UPI00035D2546|nr:glucokinase [Embleya scabrispora]MYS80932.1 glucokinase [Streptomyces sp. SID5474]
MNPTVTPPTPDRPWLVADIGGTNARFAVVTEPGGQPERVLGLRSEDHVDLAAAIEDYLDRSGAARPSAICAAVAGPVHGDRFRLTNGAWVLSIAETRVKLGVPDLHLINDFEALALSLPHLAGDDLIVVGDRLPDPTLPMAVLGPGTGLGVAGLVPIPGGGWVPLPGEGGHVLLRPAHGPDAAALEVLREERGGLGTVTAEHVLSGPGLCRLHRCTAAVHGVAAEALSPADISSRALDGTDEVCVATVETFCRLLGTFAGGVALTMGARGGVFLAGGILPRITEMLLKSEFRMGFETNPTMAPYLHRISTALVVAPHPALRGASAWLDARSTRLVEVAA